MPFHSIFIYNLQEIDIDLQKQDIYHDNAGNRDS